MIIVGNCLVSEDVVNEQFKCDLAKCKGACCVEGDSGAPLEKEEEVVIAEHFEKIKEFMDADGIDSVAQQGISVVDDFGGLVTTCKPNNECSFVTKENGFLQCAIELANTKYEFGFQKPISCHLYPIRVSKFNDYFALNYHQWSICSAACTLGAREKLPVFKFAKTALVRRFGETWYKELEDAVNEHNTDTN